MTTFGSVRIANDSPYRARSPVFCGAAFPRGTALLRGDGAVIDRATLSPIGIDGIPSAVTGERAWDDGSVRTGRLLAVPQIDGNSEQILPLVPIPATSAIPFSFGPWVHLAAVVNPRLTIIKADGSRIVTGISMSGKNLAETSAGIVSICKQRIPGTCLWWSIRTHVGSGSDVVPFRVRIHNSDPSRPDVREDWREIRFDSDVPAQFPMRGKLGLTATVAPGYLGPNSSFSWSLAGQDWLADGQGLWFFDGVWPLFDPNSLPPDLLERQDALRAAATWPVFMQHDAMAAPGIHGPFGNPGEIPAGKTLAQLDAEVTARANAFRTSRTEISRWGDWDFAEAPDTAQTGEHETHGTSLLAAQILTNNPRAQAELILASLGEARRPMHRYEANLDVVRKRNHPGLIYWSGGVQWTSQDKLGKGSAQATEVDKHWWSGPDPEHWMVESFLAPIALLTMDWDLLEMGRQEMEQLKGHGYTQLGGFATRAQAWCSYAIAWWRLLLPGELDDFSFVRGWQQWMVDWFSRKTPRGEGGWGAGPGPVRPTIVMKDQRYFWGPRLPSGQPDQNQLPPFWIIWQHQFAQWGLLALELVDPFPLFRAMVREICRMTDLFGWDDATGHPFGGRLWLPDGMANPSVTYVTDFWDSALGMWAKTIGDATSDSGTDWSIWAEGGRRASEFLAKESGDQQWIARNAQIKQWIAAIASRSALGSAKLSRWAGSMPIAPQVL